MNVKVHTANNMKPILEVAPRSHFLSPNYNNNRIDR
jgi:hypothetical protein